MLTCWDGCIISIIILYHSLTYDFATRITDSASHNTSKCLTPNTVLWVNLHSRPTPMPSILCKTARKVTGRCGMAVYPEGRSKRRRTERTAPASKRDSRSHATMGPRQLEHSQKHKKLLLLLATKRKAPKKKCHFMFATYHLNLYQCLSINVYHSLDLSAIAGHCRSPWGHNLADSGRWSLPRVLFAQPSPSHSDFRKENSVKYEAKHSEPVSCVKSNRYFSMAQGFLLRLQLLFLQVL